MNGVIEAQEAGTGAVVVAEKPLDQLYQLQEVLLGIRKRSEAMKRTPDHLLHIEAAYQERIKLTEETRVKLESARKRKSETEGGAADLGEKLKRYQQQLVLVKTNREYGALLNEIDVVKREIRAREDEQLALEEEIQGLNSEAAGRQESLPEETAEFEAQMKEWREEQQRLGAEVAEAEARASELRNKIDRRLLAQFDRIAAARQGVAVARVVLVGEQTAACSACNLRLRPQLLADVRLSRETLLCEGCKRLLYWVAG